MIISNWQSYFYFSKKELKGIIVLGIILTGSVLMSMIFSAPIHNHKTISNSDIKPIHLIYFDPNQIDSLQAINLGIPERQVRSLLHYRERGGYFKNADDFSKLYGLKNELFLILKPFIKMAAINKMDKHLYFNKSTLEKDNNEIESWKIDINNADENEWLLKTNLNKDFVHRILTYRNYVGSFSNPYQLSKIYGLPDSVFQKLRGHLYIKPGSKIILNANAMNFKDWKQLGLFTDQQVWIILRLKKQNEGKIGWEQLVEACDLTQNEAIQLKQRIRFVQ
jgi:DNA uptake protein ComE-like DNA-binding protein